MRIDKYDPIGGGFRAALAADWAKDLCLGVGLDVNGRVVKGAGVTGILGVVTVTRAMKAGDVVDVQHDGDILEFTAASNGAGKIITAINATGVLTAAVAVSSATHTVVGHTVEATRLVVRPQFPAVVPA